MSGTRGDSARATVTVGVPIDVAFEVFTKETDLWWRRGPRFRATRRSPGVLLFEGRLGGRLFESFEDGAIVEMGCVTEWEPPRRLAFEWRNQNFAPHEKTYVTVDFEERNGKTQVTVEHRGWSSLRPDHPAKHGMEASAFSRSLGMFWGDLMTSMREHAVTRSAGADVSK